MFHKRDAQKHAVFAPGTQSTFVRPPRPEAQTAVSRLSNLASGQVDVDFNASTGDVRFLTATGGGLLNLPFTGDAVSYAKLYLAQKDTITALGLRTAQLIDGEVRKFGFGTRVEFKQELTLPDHSTPLPVRGGFVHVFVDKSGEIRQVTSTVRRGRKPAKLGKIISTDQAVAFAKKAHGADVCEMKSCELVLSSHEAAQRGGNSKRSLAPSENLRLDPTYEVIIQSCKPASVRQYLVNARTGKVVYSVERLLFSQKSKDQASAAEPDCRYFPLEPDSKAALSKQLIAYTIADLPDPTRLENKRFTMMVKTSGEWEVVKAKADGTFNYDIDTPEFEAVIVFVTLNESVAKQEEWGMTPYDKPLPVYVHDEDVPDNAYADPINFDSHIGVGSGAPNGLRKFIGYDKMVPRHEVCGHIMVTIMTPGRDLPGSQGAGMHEDTGDTFAVIFDYTDHVKFAARLKKPFGVADVQKDDRVVGPYSLDGGIRVQRNTKKTPQDETGEPHDDGLISGGADCDALEALIVKANDIDKGCETFGRIKIAAMALVPAHKVLFKDMLRAMISADETLNKGANRKELMTAFAAHGIKLTGGNKKKVPGKGKTKGKSKGKTKGKSKDKTKNRRSKVA
jgi:hypothetical protein